MMRLMKATFALAASLALGNLYAQDSPDVASAKRGKMVYEQHCLACHQGDGSGVPGLAPPLIEGTFVGGEKQKLIKIVLNGMQGVEIKGEFYGNPMPGFDYLSDADIADVLTFVRSNFKNKGDAVGVADVSQVRNAK